MGRPVEVDEARVLEDEADVVTVVGVENRVGGETM